MINGETFMSQPSADMPADIRERLRAHGITTAGETELRSLLEAHAQTYTLYRLAPAAARKWKARYRIMFGATYLDSQTAPEAYARALLALLDS
jgi:hypothetical protein